MVFNNESKMSIMSARILTAVTTQLDWAFLERFLGAGDQQRSQPA